MKLKNFVMGLVCFMPSLILARGSSVCPEGSPSFEPFFVVLPVILQTENGRSALGLCYPENTSPPPLTLLSWEDLFRDGDCDFNDLIFVTNRVQHNP